MRVLPINNYNNIVTKTTTKTSFQGKVKTPLPNNEATNKSLIKDTAELAKLCIKLADKFLTFCLKAILVFLTFMTPAELGQIRKAHKESPQVRPLIKNFSSHEAALNYSIERITEQLNSDSPREYAVSINNQRHRIISEALGNDSTVNNYAPLRQYYNSIITPDYSFTSLHGHPAEKDGSTTSFSFQDFKSFIAQDNCSNEYVVNRDGKFCIMIKTEDYRKPTPEEIKELESNFSFFVRAAWPHSKTIINNKGEVVFSIIDYPGMHDYWDFTCKKFGIKYLTTFGTYGLYNDIYKDGYHEGFNKKIEVIKD